VMGRALADNSEGGQVHFIDPSFVDDFWTNPDAVSDYFAGFGVTNIQHFRLTTQQFVETDAYRALQEIGLVFVDGYHSEDQARFDYEAFRDRLATNGMALFHDSIRSRISGIYSRTQPYEHRVMCYIDELKRDASLQVFDLPFGDGVTLVRRVSS
jgi:predicted O-methyltransferase YrrM